MKNRPSLGYGLNCAAFAIAAAMPIAGKADNDVIIGSGTLLQQQGFISTPGNSPATAIIDPISVTVDCNNGGSIANALALKPLTTSRLTITILGTCTEAIDTGFNAFTLQGGSSGAGIQAPSSTTDPVLGISGQHVILSNLTISGGFDTVRGRHGGQFSGNSIVVQGGSNTNMQLSGATVDLNGSTLQNSSGNGVNVDWGAVLFVNGGTIQNNAGWGINAFAGGSVDLFGGALVQNNKLGGGIASASSIVLNDGTVKGNANGINAGLVANNSGFVQVNGSTAYVINNLWDGVDAWSGGTASVSNGATVANNSRFGVSTYNGGNVFIGGVVQSNSSDGVHAQSGNVQIGGGTQAATIQNNGKNGIYMGTNSVLSSASTSNQIINNGGWGVLCAGSPSDPLANGNLGTVSGNTSGQTGCNFGN